MSEANINPCGCGGKMELVDAYAHLKQRPSCNKYELVCQECRLQVRHPSRSTHKLISMWNTRQPDTDLVEVFRDLTKSILDSVSLEYMDDMTDGKMMKAVDALLAIKEKK